MSDTKRVTLAVAVTASGELLPPFLIFKGQRHDRITVREFATYPGKGKYDCQPKAWMDEAMMNEWINIVLKPWKDDHDASNPSIQPPIIVLDAYRVHQMGLVVNHIQVMGIEVVHMPAGCTYLYQPIDVGINKPIKTRLHELWEVCMTDGDGIVDQSANEPSCKIVAEWLIKVYRMMPAVIRRNAWRKEGYKRF
jgi:hypothetical protein